MTFDELPTAVIAGLIALATVQLTLQIISLVDLARRPTVVGGRKWPWALLIIAGTLIGALLYLALGRAMRAPTLGTGEPQAGGEAARRRAIDELYGPDQRQ